MKELQLMVSRKDEIGRSGYASSGKDASFKMNACALDFKVLVVDDSPIYWKLANRALSEEQYAVLFAKSGREAMALFSEHQPSLVITDWMIPDLSGLELCERVRHHTQQTYAYIIILTGITAPRLIRSGAMLLARWSYGTADNVNPRAREHGRPHARRRQTKS